MGIRLSRAPRFTFDLDIAIRPTPENAARLARVIERFGFASLGLSASDFQKPGQVIQLGQAPNRIDLLTSLSGLEDEEIWATREKARIDGVPVGRKQDLADLDELEGSK